MRYGRSDACGARCQHVGRKSGNAKLRIWSLGFHDAVIGAKAAKDPTEFVSVDGALCVGQLRVQRSLPLELHTVDAQNDAIDERIAIRCALVTAIENKQVATR